MKTTNFKIGAVALAATLFLASCNGTNESSEEKDGHAHHAEKNADTAEASPNEQPTTESDALNALYPHYLTLQEALVSENVAKAKEAALLIEEASKDIADASTIQSAASQILAAESIDAQRNSFAPMSEGLITLIKSSGVSKGAFYVAHCPMAFNDKGANWISPSKSIKNPYFGDKMLTCGTIEETLKSL